MIAGYSVVKMCVLDNISDSVTIGYLFRSKKKRYLLISDENIENFKMIYSSVNIIKYLPPVQNQTLIDLDSHSY